MCLQSHYRNQLVFSYNSLDGAENAYKKLVGRIAKLSKEGNIDKELFDEWNNKFKTCLEDNLNTANALTLLYDLLKSDLNEATKYSLIDSWDKVFALDLLKTMDIDEEQDSYIKDMIEKRNEAKKNKDFALADSIRDQLKEQGIILKDTKEGTIYEIEAK